VQDRVRRPADVETPDPLHRAQQLAVRRVAIVPANLERTRVRRRPNVHVGQSVPKPARLVDVTPGLKDGIARSVRADRGKPGASAADVRNDEDRIGRVIIDRVDCAGSAQRRCRARGNAGMPPLSGMILMTRGAPLPISVNAISLPSGLRSSQPTAFFAGVV
jgi:hypothetical protein